MCDQFSFHKMTIFINTAPLKIRKSANVGQFYPLKPTILYKVDPRKFHVIINIAPLQNTRQHGSSASLGGKAADRAEAPAGGLCRTASWVHEKP